MAAADFGDAVDMATFSQILEMDDGEEGDFSFSKPLVDGFFEQAENTFKDMEAALEKKDLQTLSSLGHFLKGSSATLGFVKVGAKCEDIQHYGAKHKPDGSPESEEVCLERIEEALKAVKVDYAEVKTVLGKFFEKAS